MLPTLVNDGETLDRVYSGDIATSRFQNVSALGVTRTIDVIQSLPKNGRWRHVVRYSISVPISGATPLNSAVTVTADFAASIAPADVAASIKGVMATMADAWDEVAAGQQ